MSKYIAIFNDLLGDIEINGFQIMTQKEMDDFEELAVSIGWDFKYQIGSNDNLRYSSGEDLLSRIDFKEISNETYKVLNNLFDGKFGVFVDEDFLETLVDDSDDDFDDDNEDTNYVDYNEEDDY